MKKLLLVANVSKEHVRKFHIPFILRMKEMGWQVDVACKMDAPIPECDHCYSLPCDRNPFKGGLLKSVLMLKRILQENQYDVVHCNTITGSLVGRLAAKSFRKNGLKVFYTDHGMHFYKGASASRWILGYPMEKMLARYTDVLITINQTDYNTAQKYLTSCGHIEQIHGIGVDLNRFRKAVNKADRHMVRSRLGLSDSDFILTYVAEINSNKNQKSLLEVLCLVQKIIPCTILVLVGPDHSDGAFQKLVMDKGLSGQVLLTGWRDDVPELLCSSDVYVASSKSEGLGLNLIEAMACSLPVVAYKNRGHSEIITHGSNGFLVEQDDHEKMAEYVIALHKQETLRNQITEQAQKDISKYEVENVLNELESVYSKFS